MPCTTTNIMMPYSGDSVCVTLAVEFTVERADPTVGIFGDRVEEFTAKVIDADADIEGVTREELDALQKQFDDTEGQYRDEIDEACIESLADYCGREE